MNVGVILKPAPMPKIRARTTATHKVRRWITWWLVFFLVLFVSGASFVLRVTPALPIAVPVVNPKPAAVVPAKPATLGNYL